MNVASPRQLGYGPLAQLVTRVLIAALLLALVPPPAEASLPGAPLPELPPF